MKKLKLSWIHLGIVSLLVCALMVGGVHTAQAAEFIENGNIPAGMVIDDDVFITGNSVVIDGTVNGDLFAFGNSVEVNGKVNGSLVTGGQNLIVNGEITGSVYAGSSQIVIGETAVLGRNLYYGGFSLETKPGAIINKDLYMGGYQAILSGNIKNTLAAAVGAMELNGKVGGDVRLEVGEPGNNQAPMPQVFAPPGVTKTLPLGLRISQDAEIGGKLTYTSQLEQSKQIMIKPAGGTVFQTPVPEESQNQKAPQYSGQWQIGQWVISRLREFVTLIILGAFVIWLIPVWMDNLIKRAKSKPLPAAGWGFITIILGYSAVFFAGLLIVVVTIILGAVTLGGLAQSVIGIGFSSLGLLSTVFTLLVTYGSKLVVAFLLGEFVLDKFAPQVSGHRLWPYLVGVILYVLLRSIPLLGWVIGVLATLVGLGAIFLVLRDLWKTRQLSAE